jgi:hypothetical protein
LIAAAVSGAFTYGLQKRDLALDQEGVGNLTLSKTGSAALSVTRLASADHSGISVYIPGTGLNAITDASGHATITGVPAGTWTFRAEAQGYVPVELTGVVIVSEQTTSSLQLTLVISTGVQGTAMLTSGKTCTDSKTLELQLVYSPEATLYKLAEDATFVNKPWLPITPLAQYTVASFGSTHLYVKYANANGLESSPIEVALNVLEPLNFASVGIQTYLESSNLTYGTADSMTYLVKPSWSYSLLTPTLYSEYRYAFDGAALSAWLPATTVTLPNSTKLHVGEIEVPESGTHSARFQVRNCVGESAVREKEFTTNVVVPPEDVSCSSTSYQPDTCAYGQFCFGSGWNFGVTGELNKCAVLPAAECANFGAHGTTWSAETSSGHIIHDVEQVSWETDAVFCAGSASSRLKVHVKAYSAGTPFPATKEGFPAILHAVSPAGTEISVSSSAPIQNLALSNDDKNAEFDLNLCLPEATSTYTLGLHFVGGAEVCIPLTKIN